MNRVITIFSRHYYSQHTRKTTVHFFANELAKLGYRVLFVTVGRSAVSRALKFGHASIPPDVSTSGWTETRENLAVAVCGEFVHPVSFKSPVLNLLSAPLLWQYGSSLPNHIADEIRESRYVIFECGYAIAYFDLVRRLCEEAQLVYFATDPLGVVGLRPEFNRIERSILPKFDLVRVAAPVIAEAFPDGTKVSVIPQGLDKSLFDQEVPSPYKEGVANIVSVGDMLFDEDAVIEIARCAPHAVLHLFGARLRQPAPDNICVYGEREFSEVVPYIKHADIGLMPYAVDSDCSYLVKTSLKILQYTYCGLNILGPDDLEWGYPNVFTYSRPNRSSIHRAVSQALSASKDFGLQDEVMDWSQCARMLLAALTHSKVESQGAQLADSNQGVIAESPSGG
jgi:2-beta-glucuronyltransferase